jgi:hypothetical protein
MSVSTHPAPAWMRPRMIGRLGRAPHPRRPPPEDG